MRGRTRNTVSTIANGLPYNFRAILPQAPLAKFLLGRYCIVNAVRQIDRYRRAFCVWPGKPPVSLGLRWAREKLNYRAKSKP